MSSNAALKIVPTATRQTPAEWLEEMMTRGRRERFTEVHSISPTLAELMLEHNANNRPIRNSKVAKHVKALESKAFILTHQGIAFSRDGQLNDGQHRLTAIVESRVPAPMTVTFGCKREEFEVVDQNSTRTSADLLAIKGKDAPKVRASIAARILMFEEKSSEGLTAQRVSHFSESLDAESMDAAVEIGKKGRRVTAPATLGLAYYWIKNNTKFDESKVQEFWEGLVTGAGLSASSPILKVRNKIMEGQGFDQKSGTQRSIKEAAAIVLAWNAWTGEGPKFSRGIWPYTTSLPDVI